MLSRKRRSSLMTCLSVTSVMSGELSRSLVDCHTALLSTQPFIRRWLVVANLPPRRLTAFPPLRPYGYPHNRQRKPRGRADAFNNSVAPAIRDAQAAGAKTLRQIAAALNGRGIGSGAGRQVGTAGGRERASADRVIAREPRLAARAMRSPHEPRRTSLMPANRLVLRTPRRDLGEEIGQPEIAALGV
jgi:hypothetical protein